MPPPGAAAPRRLLLAYGALAYATFAVAIVYCPGFLGGFPVPKDAADGPVAPPLVAVAVDLGLVALFGLHHSLMARGTVKRRLTRLVPEPVERSTYVLGASLLLLFLYWQWRPLPAVAWELEGWTRWAARGAMAVGWTLSLLSAQRIGHGDLFGLRQATAGARALAYVAPELRTDRLHGVVRHPMYLGFLLGVWCLPTATAGHLLFAAAMTVYLLVGIVFEERDLEARYGAAFRDYKARVPALLPVRRRVAG